MWWHTQTHTHTHTYTHVHTHTREHTYTWTQMYTRNDTHVCTHTHVHMYGYVHTHERRHTQIKKQTNLVGYKLTSENHRTETPRTQSEGGTTRWTDSVLVDSTSRDQKSCIRSCFIEVRKELLDFERKLKQKKKKGGDS